MDEPIVSADDPRLMVPVVVGRAELVTCGDEIAEMPRGADIFEMRHLFGDFYLEVPYRHLTYGWPVFHRIRVRKLTEPR